MAPPLAITTAFALSFMDATAARCFQKGAPVHACGNRTVPFALVQMVPQPQFSVNDAGADCDRATWIDTVFACIELLAMLGIAFTSCPQMPFHSPLLYCTQSGRMSGDLELFVVQDSIHSVGEIVAWQVFPLVADAHTFLPRLLV